MDYGLVILRESGGSSTPQPRGSIATALEYLVARSSRAMTDVCGEQSGPRSQRHLDVSATCAANACLMITSGLQELTEWLIDGARSAPTPVALLRETCERLIAAGLPLWRVGAFVRTLHPDASGRSFIWRQGAEVVINIADFDLPESPEFLQSPLAILYGSGQEVRYRLDDPESRRFPFFDDMRGEGV